MRVQVQASYEPEPDKYFWLRESPDGSEVDGLRRRVAAVVEGLPFRAQMLLDSAVAGEPRGAPAIVQALPELPEQIEGLPVRDALAELADVLFAAPPPPPERAQVVQQALKLVDLTKIEDAISWVAEVLGFTFADEKSFTVTTYVVAGGLPLGGLTGFRIDDSPVCFVAVQGQEGSTFSEALIHEATHVLDIRCDADTSMIARLRRSPQSSHQLWHAPYFVAAAEATRRFVDPAHRDYGDTHGYYAKVPQEMARLEREGIIETIRLHPS